MSRLVVTFAAGTGATLNPLLDSAVASDRVKLVPTRVHPADLFRRQFERAEFDASEMSLASLIISWSRGDRGWQVLPILPRRDFFHTYVRVRAGGRVRSPRDLNGCRIGVPEYQMSAAVWARGIFAREFGFRPQSAQWFIERPPENSIGAVTEVAIPHGISAQPIAPTDNMRSMLRRGDLDAVLLFVDELHPAQTSPVDRGAGVPSEGITALFPDPVAEGARYLAHSGTLPANHCIVVRSALVEQQPWLINELATMFESARIIASREARATLRLAAQTGQAGKIVRDFEFPAYGATSTLQVMQLLADFLFDQGLCHERVAVMEKFAAPI